MAAGETARPIQRSDGIERHSFLGASFDQLPYASVVRLIGETKGKDGFRYVVTPNVDHVVRLSRMPQLNSCYDEAWLSLCDSRPMSWLAHFMPPLSLPRVTGADLTAGLFAEVIAAGDRVSIIASNEEVVQRMHEKYPALDLHTYIPPHGFADHPVEMMRCIDFILASKADFTFIAVGSPQSEKLAFAVSQEPTARGICLCVGASLEFLTGIKKRAPRWMQSLGIEWLHRLGSDPKRLWRRYVFAFPPFARLAASEAKRRWGGAAHSLASHLEAAVSRLFHGHRAFR